MLTLQFIHTIVLLVAIILINECNSFPTIRQRDDIRPLCMGCGDECDKCKYGVTKSHHCGIMQCRRGPGEICGGPSDVWGECGNGLFCSCNRCDGCSMDTFECNDRPCLPHQMLAEHLRSYLKTNNGIYVAE